MAKSPSLSSLLCYEGFESPTISNPPCYEGSINFKIPTVSHLCYEGLINLDYGDSWKTDSEEEDSEWEVEDLPVTQDDEEHVMALLDKEIKENVGLPFSPESSMVVSEDWITEARKEAVKYIRGTCISNGFRHQTAYMAIAYHDAFISREVDMEEQSILRSAAVACLWLASKYEETMTIRLSMFPTTENYHFDDKILEKTESTVLNKLNWRMQILTPFAFTYYFISKFLHNQPTASSSSLRDLTSKSEALIFNAITDTEDRKLMRHHKPSTIAAAAALVVIDGNTTKQTMELNINALSLNAYLCIEEIWSLYNQLKREREKWETTSNPVL